MADVGGSSLPRPPRLGEAAPDFITRSTVNPRFVFNTVGGRYIALAFFGTERPEENAAAMDAVQAAGGLFNGVHAAPLAVVGHEAQAASAGKVTALFDEDGAIARAWGVDPAKGGWRLLDPSLRLIGTAPLSAGDSIVETLSQAAPPGSHAGIEGWAPVLLVPRVFEPELCQALIAEYQRRGGDKSGFMREVDGKTVLRHDPSHKRRRDVDLTDQPLMNATRFRVLNRLVPELKRAFAFEATRMERYLVARYGAEEQGFFRAHRDNTTPGTAHRRFAVTLNLNANDYEGGELRFPEYAQRTYKPPTGAAVVFSCSMLHEATPVTKGERYAFLPFLYDDAAARLREENAHRVEGSGSNYRAG